MFRFLHELQVRIILVTLFRKEDGRELLGMADKITFRLPTTATRTLDPPVE